MPRWILFCFALACVLIGISLGAGFYDFTGAGIALGAMVRPDYNGVPYQSAPVPVTAAGRYRFDLSFLEAAMRMTAPVIQRFTILFRGTITPDADNDATPLDQFKILSLINIRDRGGELYNRSGIMNFVEQAQDVGVDRVAFPPTIPNGAQPVAANINPWRIFWDPPDDAKVHRSADLGLPCLYMLPRFGGQFEFQVQLPANVDALDGDFILMADVVDERRRELKSRRVRNYRQIGKVDDLYPVGGSLRSAIVTSDLGTATGFTELDFATYSDWTSRTLEYVQVFSQWLKDSYLIESPAAAINLVDPFLTSLATGVGDQADAIDLLGPKLDQHVGWMQDIEQLHVKFATGATVPTGGVLMLEYVEDRDAEQAREWMGFPSIADLAAAVVDRGEVKGTGESNAKVTDWDETLVRRLPMRIPAMARR